MPPNQGKPRAVGQPAQSRQPAPPPQALSLGTLPQQPEQSQQTPGLFQRIGQTIGHFFGGTLGQHGQAPGADWGQNMGQGQGDMPGVPSGTLAAMHAAQGGGTVGDWMSRHPATVGDYGDWQSRFGNPTASMGGGGGGSGLGQGISAIGSGLSQAGQTIASSAKPWQVQPDAIGKFGSPVGKNETEDFEKRFQQMST